MLSLIIKMLHLFNASDRVRLFVIYYGLDLLLGKAVLDVIRETKQEI